MAAPRSWALWSYCGRRWSRAMRGCQLLGLRSSWPGAPLSARLLSQEKRATETHFGFETVSEEEKGGKVYQVFESVAKKYDVMNDMMSLGIHRLWKDLLLWKMRPLPGTQLLDVAGGTGDIAFRFLNYVQSQHQRKQKRQLRARQSLSWEEIAKEYQNEADSLGGSHVMVCDINKEMLKVGKQKALAQGYRAGLAWVLGDAEELPFDDDKFDIYTIAFGIRNVTHIDQVPMAASRACMESHCVAQVGMQWRDVGSLQPLPPGFKCFFSLASQVAGITGTCYHAQLIFVFLVKTGFHYVGQDGLDLLTS
ncbi:2-methoxy-6-polyprenyl-1,4-benzoquinol methylase, mitochondrial [Plecturocebus cupreus]